MRKKPIEKLLEQAEMLVTIIFSFSDNVFYIFMNNSYLMVLSHSAFDKDDCKMFSYSKELIFYYMTKLSRGFKTMNI